MFERVAQALPLLMLGCQSAADDTSANNAASATDSASETGSMSSGSASSEATSVLPPAASSPAGPLGSSTAVPPQSSSSTGTDPSVNIPIPPVSVNPTTSMSPTGAGGSSPEPTETGGSSAVGGSSSGGVAGATTAGAGSTALGGAGGSGVAGSPAVAESEGCGIAATAELETWVESTVTAAELERRIWVRLPGNYDPNRVYPLVVLLHGCGDENNNVPMQNAAGDDAILVRGVAQTDCWDTGGDSPDVPLFEEMIRYSAANFCVDEQRVFAVGYSSGSWLINRLSCDRPELFRAAGTVAGGNPGGGDCSSAGNIAHIFIHDLDDVDNDISGSESARDRLLAANSCDASAALIPEDPEPCARYQSCDPLYPIVWCPTSGEGHGRQDDLAASAFWNFFMGLPSP